MLTLLVPKPHVGLVDFVDSFCAPELLRGWAVPGPGLFMPKACFSCSLEMKAAGRKQQQRAVTHGHVSGVHNSACLHSKAPVAAQDTCGCNSTLQDIAAAVKLSKQTACAV